MDVLETKKTKSELARVMAARLEMEYRIEERLQEVERLKDQIQIQEAKEKELSDKLKN